MIVARLPRKVSSPARKWEPNVDRAWRKHLRRHDADNRERLVAEIYRFPKHVPVAVEHALPEFVADHANWRAPHAIFFLSEHAPELRLEPGDLKKVSGNESSRDL